MLIRLFAAAWALLCATAAAAAPLPVPTVGYCADRTMETSSGTFTGRACASDGRERTETEMKGMTSVMIVRPDLKVGWMLMPAQKMYQEIDLAKARQQTGSAAPDNVSITEVGPETIEGVATTKYKLLMKDGTAGGFMWFTAEGIAMKMDLLQKSGGKSERMTITLKNLQTGPQDPATFEVPAGYSKLPSMGGFPGMGGMGAGRGTPTGGVAGGVAAGAKKLFGFGG